MEPAKLLMTIGGVVLAGGLLLYYAPWLLSWFGKLPGDIHIENKNTEIFIPITSMLVISLVLTLALNIFFRK